MEVIDFASGEIPPHLIRAAGYGGIVVYVSESRPGSGLGAKPIRRHYADAVTAEGLQIVSNYQYGKPGGLAPSDFTRGFSGGVADATIAARLHGEAGGPEDAPIIFSIDEDIDLRTWNDTAVQWFRGINSVIGRARTGIYGHSRVCAWALQDEVIGHSTTPGRGWVWQTRAWSGDEREPAAVLYQSVIDTPSQRGPLVGDVHVDVNEVLAEDFGQWSLDRAPGSGSGMPQFNESDEIRSPYCDRRRADVLWFVLHTEDGDSGSARNLARYLSNNEPGVSYHYTVDDDGHVYVVVDPKLSANSVFEPGNSRSINLAFASSKAAWSRQTWFNSMKRGMDIAAYIAVRDARRFGLRPEVISRAQVNRWETGITDHGAVVEATNTGDHTDVGAGFPWDYFSDKVDEFARRWDQRVGVSVRSLPPTDEVRVSTRQELFEADRAFHAGRAATCGGGTATKSDGVLESKGPYPGRGGPTSHRLDEPMVRQIAPYRMVTGPGITSSVHMEFADLGIMRWDPGRGAIAAMFGDNFSFGWGMDWQSPSIVMYDSNYNVIGVPRPDNGIAQNQSRRQLWPYGHNNPYFDTVLPCDFIRVGDWWYVAVMLSKGPLERPNAQFATEFWRSRDLVRWEFTGPKFDHRFDHPGNTMLTFDQIGEWVYIFGTGGLTRDKPVWMWRNKASDFPHGYWEPWGWDGFRWGWGIPNEGTPMLRGRFGELCFRHLNGNCVLSYLEGGRMTARTVAIPEHNWQDGANVIDYVNGFQIRNLYGGYISPLSRLNVNGGIKFFVSQWIDTSNYRVYLVEGTLFARGPLRESVDSRTMVESVTLTEKMVMRTYDQFPLPDGQFWGPLDGYEKRLSTRGDHQHAHYSDELRRWQEAIGVYGSGAFDDATKEAAARMQYLRGWMPSLGSTQRGVIGQLEWDEVIVNGWTLPAPPEKVAGAKRASSTDHDIGWYPGPGFTPGHGEYRRIYLHTTESQDWISTAEEVAAEQAVRREVSYHYLVDDHHIINTVPAQHTAWAVRRDNPVSIQIAMVCTSGAKGCWLGGTNPNSEEHPKTREQWLAHDKMLDMVAFTIAKISTEHGIPLHWCEIDDIGENLAGISSHYNYSRGSKDLHRNSLSGSTDGAAWDVPSSFPHDVVLDAAKVYAEAMQRRDGASVDGDGDSKGDRRRMVAKKTPPKVATAEKKASPGDAAAEKMRVKVLRTDG